MAPEWTPILQDVVNRRTRAGDLDGALIFLASDASAYVTGQTLHVNGGMYMA